MIKHDVVNIKNQVVGAVELPESVFGQRVNESLVHQVIKAQLAGMRQGTAKAKCKSEVRGGGKKPFKQKGTGNARQGSSRSPLNPGGGESFGPQPRSYKQDTPKKMVKGALRSVLSDKLAAQRMLVLDKIEVSGKTKELASILTECFKLGKAVVVDSKNEKLLRATRNIPSVRYLSIENVSVYELVKYEWLLCSKEAIESLSKSLAN